MTLYAIQVRQKHASEMYMAHMRAGRVDAAQWWAGEVGRLWNRRAQGPAPR